MMLEVGVERRFEVQFVRDFETVRSYMHALCVFVSYGRVEMDGGTISLLSRQ